MSPLHHQTPCLCAEALSAQTGREVWLKMECHQPSGSFKLRGIGALCQNLARQGAQELCSSSGGNAGYSAAWTARKLGLPSQIFVPQSTPDPVRQAMVQVGAKVIVSGSVWDEAHAAMLAYLQTHPNAAGIHPFDDSRIWSGHASMIAEAMQQMPCPDLIVLSVGGGGLLSGVAQGLHQSHFQAGWKNVPILAVETTGAASFHAALAAGRPVKLERIETVVTTLGARQVCQQAISWAKQHPISSFLVSDAEALSACRDFANQARVLVEPACGAALAALYSHAETLPEPFERILVIVCGGIGVDLDLLERERV